MKFSAHCLGPSTRGWEMVRKGGSRAILLMDDLRVPPSDDPVWQLPQPPLIIARHYFEGPMDIDPNALWQNPANSPEWFAEQHVAFLDHEYRANPRVDVWLGLNEKAFGTLGWDDPDAAQGMAWYARFEARRAQLLREVYNRAAGVGSFSTGTPYIPMERPDPFYLLRAFEPALDACRRYGGYLSLHAYALPERWTDPLLLFLHRRWLQYMGGRPVPILLTETGMDSLMGMGGNWRDLKWSPQQYAAFLLWVEGELQRDPWVFAAFLYTLGHQWEGFEVEDTIVPDLLIEYGQAHPEDKMLNVQQFVLPQAQATEFFRIQQAMIDYLGARGSMEGWRWPSWQKGDIALAIVNPLPLYERPELSAPSRLMRVTWDMDVREVLAGWLRVTGLDQAGSPGMWTAIDNVVKKNG